MIIFDECSFKLQLSKDIRKKLWQKLDYVYTSQDVTAIIEATIAAASVLVDIAKLAW